MPRLYNINAGILIHPAIVLVLHYLLIDRLRLGNGKFGPAQFANALAFHYICL